MTDVLAEAVAQAERELATRPTHVWMATLDMNYDGITIIGVFETIQAAKKACETHHRQPLPTWIADTYEDDFYKGEVVTYEATDRTGTAYVVTRMEIRP